FEQKYKAHYGATPDALAALGYDAAAVMFDAMDRAKSLDGEDLAPAIAATKDFAGVTGSITIDKDRNAVKSAVVLVMKGGAPHFVASVTPPSGPLPEPPEGDGGDDSEGGGGGGWQKLLQTLVNTLALGALYALIALGYTLVYGVLGFINFAHADVFTFGAWSSFTLALVFGWGGGDVPWIALPVIMLIVMAICALLGVAIERFAYRPLRRAPRLNVLITAIGVSLFLEHSGQLTGFEVARAGEIVARWPFGPNPQKMPALISDDSLLTIAGVSIRTVDVVVV